MASNNKFVLVRVVCGHIPSFSPLLCITTYYPNSILYKELRQPLLPCITLPYSLLLSKIDVIIDNIQAMFRITYRQFNEKSTPQTINKIPPNVAYPAP